MIKRIFYSFFLCLSALEAIQIPAHGGFPSHPTIKPPWFTGPLLAPSALTVPPGHFNLEPYIFCIANTGHYDPHWHRVKTETFWNNYVQPELQVGLSSWLDFQFYPTLFYNYTKGAGKWAIGDIPLGLDIQLYKRIRPLDQWTTALKLGLKEIVPLGKYRNLNPKKKLTDIGGGGSWQTGFNLIWGNLFYIGNNRFITWRNSFLYTLPAPVHVKNLNAYGGGSGTNGTVYPAQSFQIDTAIEINLNQNWAFAMDFVGSWSGKTRFKGKTLVPNKSPSSAQFSLAPAIEYNWSANMGIIFGSWFTVAGRNDTQFVSGIFAFNYFR